MPQASQLTAFGVAAEPARLLGQAAARTGQTATGSTIADAFALTSGECVEFTTVGSGTGALLPPAGESADVVIVNAGSNALTVYPQSGEYMNGTADATFSVTNAKRALFKANGSRWTAFLSA